MASVIDTSIQKSCDVKSDLDNSEPSIASLPDDMTSDVKEMTIDKAEERLEIETTHHDTLLPQNTKQNINEEKKKTKEFEKQHKEILIEMTDEEIQEVSKIIPEVKIEMSQDVSQKLIPKISDARIPLWNDDRDKKKVRAIRISFLVSILVLIMICTSIFIVIGICI
ncbi:hypothetical protein QTN25_002204 [Entamoeba marina]